MKRRFLTAALLLSVALALALTHYAIIDRPFLDARLTLHNQIIDGSAESPYRYRVLAPFVGEGLTSLLESAGLNQWRAFSLAYAALQGGLISLLLFSLFAFLRQWLSWWPSLAGVLLTAAVFPFTLLEQYFQPWSYLEVALLALTLLAARSRRPLLWGAICVLLASLNRESGIFAAAGFFLVTFDFERLLVGLRARRLDVDWRGLLGGILMAAIWLAIFWGLRAWRGSTPQIHSLAYLWDYNTQPRALLKALIYWLAFSGLLWMLWARGLRSAPVFFKRLAWLLPLYLVTILAWGIWTEVRLLLPLFVILLPPALLYAQNIISSQGEPS